MNGLFSRREFIHSVARNSLLISLAGISSASGGIKQQKDGAGLWPAQTYEKPPMGWNSFDSYGVYLHEEAARKNLETMAEVYKPAGYEYFVVDNGWFGEYKLVKDTKYPAEKHASTINIDEYGVVHPSKTYFPHGLRPLIEKAHALGLKFGLHLMRGIPRRAVEKNLPIKNSRYRAADIANRESICSWCHYNYGIDMSRPGAQEYYNSVVDKFASWGVDFLKVDDVTGYPLEVLGYARAIAQSGRDIQLSLSPGGNTQFHYLPYYRKANMLRVTKDIWDRAEDINKGFNAWKKYQGVQSEGFYPDLDMIPFGRLQLMSPDWLEDSESNVNLAGYGYSRMDQFTPEQKYTFLTIRALGASPLMIGGDLPTMDSFSKKLLLNAEMLRCNQNGVVGTQIYDSAEIEIWFTPERELPGNGWIGIFNRTSSQREVDITAADIGLINEQYVERNEKVREFELHDIWNNRTFQVANSIQNFSIPGEGVIFLRIQERV